MSLSKQIQSLTQQIQSVAVIKVQLRNYKDFKKYVLENLDGLNLKKPTPFGVVARDALAAVNLFDVRKDTKKELKELFSCSLIVGKIITLTIIKFGHPRFYDLFLEMPYEQVRIY